MKRIFSLLVIIAFMNVLVIGPVNANTEAAVAEEAPKAEAGGENAVLEEAPKAEAAKITLSVSVPNVYLKQKATVQAKVAIVGETSDKVVWKSGNENIATVDQNGKITANAKNSGKVVITATVGDVSANKTIFVWNAKLKGGNYYTYPNSSVKSSQKGIVASGKEKVMYFSLEKSAKGSYKIINYVGGKTANNAKINNRYFSSSALKSKYWELGYIPEEKVAAQQSAVKPETKSSSTKSSSTKSTSKEPIGKEPTSKTPSSSQTTTKPATCNHDMKVAEKNSKTHKLKCSKCGAWGRELSHNFKVTTANCITTKKCSVCSYQLKSTSHTYATYYKIKGDIAYHNVQCTICRDTKKQGHSLETINEIVNLGKDHKCKLCGIKLNLK